MLVILSGQRRRIVYFSVTAALGLFLIGLLPGLRWYSQLLSLLLAPAALAAIAAALLAYRPGKRGWLECIGTGLLLGGALGALTPMGGLAGLPLAALASAGLVTALHEGWRDRIALTVPFRASARGEVRAGGAELWAAVVPGAGRMVSERLVDLERGGADPASFQGGLMACGELAEEITLTLLEADAGGRARLHVTGEDAEGRVTSGTLTLQIAELAPETAQLSLAESREGMTPGKALERWFDDPLGCELRHLQRHFRALNPPPAPAETPDEPAARTAARTAAAQTAPTPPTRQTGEPPKTMQDLTPLPEDHLTLEAVRKAVNG